MGLLNAVYSFNPQKSVKFSTYAVPMIAGEIKRFMRDDGSVKVSRTMKQTAKEINLFIEGIVGKNPNIDAVAILPTLLSVMSGASYMLSMLLVLL